MLRRQLIIGLSLILLLLSTGTAGASSRLAQVQDTTVLDWNRYAAEALVSAPQTPPVSLLHMAMVQGAVYDAVNMIHRGYEPYLDDLPRAPTWASKPAAVATAAHHVLVGLGIAPVPGLPQPVITQLNTLYTNALAAIPNGAAKEAGIAAGAAAAAAMLDERTGDGRYVPFSFIAGDEPGEWVPTASGFDPFAWVAKVDPFLMTGPSQFRTDGPYDLDSEAYAEEYQEVKDYGGNGTTTPTLRTPEQTATAMFFTANPMEMFNRTFRTIAQDKNLDLVQQARLFAMLNLAGADAAIGCWDDKAHWSFWRPVTAIQQGDSDGNPATVGDPTWTSLVGSPPYPDHPSGYNCAAGAFMHTAANFFGDDRVAFSLVKITPGVPDVTRNYQRFTDVLKDTIDARIWLGIHFRAPDVQGAELGADVARWLDGRFLEAVPIGASNEQMGLVDTSRGWWDVPVAIPPSLALTADGVPFYFGNPGDVPMLGDWNCDGIDTPGLYRQSDGFVYLRNSNTQGIADIRFFFGNPGDVPVAGDFNGDGCDTVSVYRPSTNQVFVIDKLGANNAGLGAATTTFVFGDAGDVPFAGDFDGDGDDTIAVRRVSTGTVHYRNTLTSGPATNSFQWGEAGDVVFAGDWNRDGVDTPASFRASNSTFYWRNTNSAGSADGTASVVTTGTPYPVSGFVD